VGATLTGAIRRYSDPTIPGWRRYGGCIGVPADCVRLEP